MTDAPEVAGFEFFAACPLHVPDLLAAELRQRDVRGPEIPDARLALGLAVPHQDQPLESIRHARTFASTCGLVNPETPGGKRAS